MTDVLAPGGAKAAAFDSLFSADARAFIPSPILLRMRFAKENEANLTEGARRLGAFLKERLA